MTVCALLFCISFLYIQIQYQSTLSNMKKQFSILGLMLCMMPISVFAQVSQAFVDTSTPITGTAAAGTTVDVMFTLQNIGNRDLDWQVAQYGETVYFTKDGGDDPNDEAFQDRIEDDIWITRGRNKSLYNIARETEHNSLYSPMGVLFSGFSTAASSPSDYAVQREGLDAVGNRSWRSNLNQTKSMYLPEYGRYFDIIVSDFDFRAQTEEGAKVDYTRTEVFLWITSLMPSGNILPNASDDVTVTFDATNLLPGVYTGHVKIETNNTDDPDYLVPVEFTVTNGSTPVMMSNASIAFGDAYEGMDNSMSYIIENTGNGTLNITDISFDDAAFTSVTSVVDIEPGDSFDLEVILNPTSQTAQMGNMTITSNDASSPAVIPMTGTGVDLPQITLSVTSFSESVASGATSDVILNISNPGANDLEFNLVLNLGTSDPVMFTKETGADYISPANHDLITPNVWLSRGDYGILYNAATGQSFNQSGGDATPDDTEWAATVSTANAMASDYLTSGFYSPKNLNSGVSSLNQFKSFNDTESSLHLMTDERYFDISFNSYVGGGGGSGNATGSRGVSYTRTEYYHWVYASVSTEGFSYSNTVVAAANEDITLTFNAMTLPAGTYMGTLELQTNVPGQELISIPVELTITDAAPNASVYESDLDFDIVQINDVRTINATIVNTGTADLNVTNITSADAAFVPSITTLTIPPMSIGEVEIAFTPTAEQAYAADLTVATDDTNNATIIVPMTGEGITIDINHTEDVLGLTGVMVTTGDAAVMRTLTIENLGSGDLNWSIASILGGTQIVTVSKENYADRFLEENQDRIADDVWISRDTGGGFFNAVTKNTGSSEGVIEGTEWAEGPSLRPQGPYDEYRESYDDPQYWIGNPYTLYVESTRKYYDLIVDFWQGSAEGGGFSYHRWETPGWLTADVASGTQTGISNTVVTLSYNAEQLTTGTYTANIILTSNDADEQEIIIPVELIVTGIPVLNTDTGTNLNIDPVYTGITQEGIITITNTGTDDLIITDIVSSSAEITVDATTATIAPGDSFELNGTITPSVSGAFSETLTITSNDGATPGTDYVITFDGTVMDAPDIAVTPTSIDKDIAVDASDTQVITISNSGTGDLDWDLTNLPVWMTSDIGNNGTILTGALDVDITLTIDMNGQAQGTYQDIIYVNSDDPDSPIIEIDYHIEHNGILVTGPLADQLVNEGFVSQNVDYSSTFTLSDAPNTTYIISTSDANVVTATDVTGSIDIAETGTGSSFITIRAADLSTVAFEDFIFRVNDIPDATGVADITVDEGFGSQDIAAADFFTDTDMEDVPSYSVASGTTSVVTTALAASILTVTEVGIGSSVITMDIDDNSGGTNTDDITFRVNDIPNLDNPIADINSVRDAATQDIGLASVFSDSDAGDVLTYSAMSSDPAVATVSVTGTTLSVTEVALGNTTITVTVDDGVTAATLPTDDFMFTIACSTVVPTITTTGVDDESDEFILTSSSATGNQWFLDGVAISGATSQTYSVSEAGSFSVQVSSAAGDCISGMSDPVAVTGVSDVGLTTISIWPNPVQSNLTLSGLGIKDYRVFDTQGKEVILQQNTQVENGVYNLDVSGLRKGIYILKISTDSGSEHQMRFVKD